MRRILYLILGIIMLLGIALPAARPVLADSSGPNGGSTFASISFTGADNSWSSPGNAATSNDTRATATVTGSSDVTYYLQATGFGFSIPAGSTINGIEVHIERSAVCVGSCTSQVRDNRVRLVKTGTVGTTDRAATGTDWPATDATATYGGASDLWGTTWTVADINSTTTGVVISAGRTTGGDKTARVDYISMTVYYTPTITYTITATAGAGGTITPSGAVSVNEGNSQTFDITPNTSYIVSDVVVDSVSQGRINSYTFTNVTANHTIAASFENGWKQPTLNAEGGGSSVGNPTYAYTSNNQRAQYNSTNDVNSYYGFGLAIPGGTIDGIQVSIEGYRDSSSTRTWDVSLSYNGGSNWTAIKNTGSLQPYDTTIVLGGSGDDWGYGLWTPAIINSNNFRVRMDASSGGDSIWLDQVQVKIYYTLQAPTIISFTPTSGCTGTSVIITGTNFTGATAVQFGGTNATSFTVNTATQITAVVGSGSSGNIRVTTPGGTATSSGSFTYNIPVVWYRDSDGDGYGNINVQQTSCSQPSGYVSNNTDCNDTNPNVHPGALDVCDGIDNDCDTLIDNDDPDFIPIRVQLAILLDGSTSISGTDFTNMKNGLASAIENASPGCFVHDGSIELTVIQIGLVGSVGAAVQVPPTVITASNATSVANTIRAITKRGGFTPLACAFYLAADTLHNSPCFSTSEKQVINLVTDGIPNRCCPSDSYTSGGCDTCSTDGCQAAMDSTVAARNYAISLLGMTSTQDEIDAEFIGSQNIDSDWLRDAVVWPQPGSYVTPPPYPPPGWVQVIANGTAYANTICAKLMQVTCSGPDADFSGTPTTVCQGHTATFTDSSIGATSWSWTFTDGTPATANTQGPHIITYNTPGTYTVALTATNYCGSDTETKTGYITVVAPCIATTPDFSICQNTELTEQLFIDNGASCPGGCTRTIDYSQVDTSTPATYDYTVTCHNSTCSDNVTTGHVTINPLPDCTIDAPVAVCADSTGNSASVPDAGPSAAYDWNITGNGTITSSTPYGSSITWDAGAAGTATISITITDANGCSCSNEGISVTINLLPDCSITTSSSVCANSTGHTASVTSVTGAIYSWSMTGNGAITSTPPYTNSITWDATGAGTATIYITITDINGCSCTNGGTAVTVNPLPDCTIDAPVAICADSTGNSASVPDAGPGAAYNWNIIGNGTITSSTPYDNSITWNATGAGTATISITITDTNGCNCSNEGTSVTINPVPTATASSNSPVCIGATLQLTGGADNMTSYSWTGPNSFSSNQQSPAISNVNAAMTGTYTLIVTDGGCTSDNATVDVSIIECGVGGGGGITVGEVGFGQTTTVAGATCPLTLTVNMLGQITTATMTSDGVLCQDCLAFDLSKQNSWEAKAGTKLTLKGNRVPQLIKVALAGSSPPSGTAETIGPTYEINAYASLNGTTPYAINISPLFSMSSAYDPNALPNNISEVTLSYYPNPNQGWLAMGSEGVVAQSGEVRGTLNYFAPDTLLAKLAQAAAKFEASDLTISPTQTTPSQQITISVNLANTGGSSGDYTVELKINGTVKESKQVTLATGASQIVSFTITGAAVGRYQVEIAGLKSEFVVARPTGLNWWLIGGIIAAIILAAGIWILVRWRRFS